MDAQNNPNLKSEVSFVETKLWELEGYPPGSKRVDTLEYNPGTNTVCAYDYKTGNAELSVARAMELATAAQNWKPNSRFVMIPVKP